MESRKYIGMDVHHASISSWIISSIWNTSLIREDRGELAVVSAEVFRGAAEVRRCSHENAPMAWRR